jgi:hypothetical protein
MKLTASSHKSQGLLAAIVDKSIGDTPSHRRAYMMVRSVVPRPYWGTSDIQRFPGVAIFVLINFLPLELAHQQVLLYMPFLTPFRLLTLT